MSLLRARPKAELHSERAEWSSPSNHKQLRKSTEGTRLPVYCNHWNIKFLFQFFHFENKITKKFKFKKQCLEISKMSLREEELRQKVLL